MIKNDINLPESIFDAMVANIYSAGEADYTPSSLALDPKEYWGRKKFPKLPIPCSGLWASFTGTLMHSGLELLLEKYNSMMKENHPELENYPKKNGYYILEKRMTISFNDHAKLFKLPEDRLIGGAVDAMFYNNETKSVKLYDFKTMSTTSIILEDKIREFTEKANIYRWLLENSGIRVSEIEYIPIFKDWTFAKASRSGKIQELPAIPLKIEMWTRHQIEEMLYNKITWIEKFKNTEYNDIPYCSPEARWEGPPVWKIYKVKNGVESQSCMPKSQRDTEEESIEMLKEYLFKAKEGETYISKKTGGIPTKCLSYCSLGAHGKCKFLEGTNAESES